MNNLKTKLGAVAVLVIVPLIAFSAPVKRLFQDVKLPTQAVMEHQTITAPALASATLLKTAQATSSGATTTVTSFSAQPDVPRNITIDPGGTTADVPGGTITVTGTNIFNATITENFTSVENDGTALTGTKAFKTVTSVVFPIQDGLNATYDIGTGSKLGLNRCTANAGAYAWSVFDNAYESTRGTLVSDTNEVEKNVFTPNGTPDDSKNVEIYYVQNYGCFP
jgi:hypothetical protein